MLDIIDWSKERPRHDDLGRYVLDVQMAAPKTKFVYHIGMSGSSSMLKSCSLICLKEDTCISCKSHWINPKIEPLPISQSDPRNGNSDRLST